jgi:hypothetical protein
MRTILIIGKIGLFFNSFASKSDKRSCIVIGDLSLALAEKNQQYILMLPQSPDILMKMKTNNKPFKMPSIVISMLPAHLHIQV